MHTAGSLIALFLVGSVVVQADPQSATHNAVEAIDIGSRLELMLDDYLIESMKNTSFRLQAPRRTEKVVFSEAPWERSVELCPNHVTVFRDGDLYRMYYRGYTKPPGFSWETDQVACYAESRDGIKWTKPPVGIFDWKGSKDNNIVWRGGQIAPFIDTRPGVPPEQRYKTLAGNPPYALVSGDGIRWRHLREEPVFPKGRFGLAILDASKKQYIAYVRAKTKEGCRSMAYSTSSDFINWSPPVLLDFGDAPPEHLYWNFGCRYFRTPHLYFAFPMRLAYHEGEKLDRADAVLLYGRDGFHYSRRYMEAFLRPGQDPGNWNPHCNMMAWGILPTGEDEISMYYTDNTYLPDANIRRLVLRTDGFVSLRAPYAGGEFTTKPLTFTGKELVLNVSTSAAGSVRVEIQDLAGKPLEGFGLKDCREFIGDKTAHVVSWARGNSLSALIGQSVRLRVVMRDCDLYSLQFKE